MGFELVMGLKVGGQSSAAQHTPYIASACKPQFPHCWPNWRKYWYDCCTYTCIVLHSSLQTGHIAQAGRSRSGFSRAGSVPSFLSVALQIASLKQHNSQKGRARLCGCRL